VPGAGTVRPLTDVPAALDQAVADARSLHAGG
jgi:hypothetical protein